MPDDLSDLEEEVRRALGEEIKQDLPVAIVVQPEVRVLPRLADFNDDAIIRAIAAGMLAFVVYALGTIFIGAMHLAVSNVNTAKMLSETRYMVEHVYDKGGN
jgi:hypothetical protein